MISSQHYCTIGGIVSIWQWNFSEWRVVSHCTHPNNTLFDNSRFPKYAFAPATTPNDCHDSIYPDDVYVTKPDIVGENIFIHLNSFTKTLQRIGKVRQINGLWTVSDSTGRTRVKDAESKHQGIIKFIRLRDKLNA